MTRIGLSPVLLAVIAVSSGCSPFQLGREEPPWADRVTCQRIERQECLRRASELVSRLSNPEGIRNIEGIVVSPEVTCLTDQQVPTC